MQSIRHRQLNCKTCWVITIRVDVWTRQRREKFTTGTKNWRTTHWKKGGSQLVEGGERRIILHLQIQHKLSMRMNGNAHQTPICNRIIRAQIFFKCHLNSSWSLNTTYCKGKGEEEKSRNVRILRETFQVFRRFTWICLQLKAHRLANPSQAERVFACNHSSRQMMMPNVKIKPLSLVASYGD